MQVKPVASPHQVAPNNVNPQAQASAKARAMAILTQSAAPQPDAHAQPASRVVGNQSNVSIEELGALKTQAPAEDLGQEISSETPVEETPVKQVDPQLSRQFAQLARQERQLREKAKQQEAAWKAKEDAFKAREAELLGKSAAPDLSSYISRDKLKQDPLSVLADAGISYDELTNQILNQAPRDPRVEARMEVLQDQIKKLTEANEQSQKTYTEQQQAQYNAAVKQIETDVKQLVYTDPNYETVRATGSVKDVVDLIKQTYDQDGILLSVEEATQQVEDYLVDEALKIAKLSKIQKRMQTPAATVNAANKPASQQGKSQQPQMRTLTNAAASSRQLSAKERAILAFKGQL